MAETTIAKATFFTTNIELPVKAIVVSNSLKGADVHELEEHFKELLQALNPNDYLPNIKTDYDNCRILMKWAYTCHASLENYFNSLDAEGNRAVNFSFGFVDINEMHHFVQGLTTL